VAINTTTNVWQSVTNQAVLTGTTNTTIGNVFLPKTQEMFAYDADGNLTNDGRWSFIWDAENRPLQMLSSNVVDGAKEKQNRLNLERFCVQPDINQPVCV